MSYTQQNLEDALRGILTPGEFISLRSHGVKLPMMCNIACYEVVMERIDTDSWAVTILSQAMRDLLREGHFNFKGECDE